MPLRVHAIQSRFTLRCDGSREVWSLWQLLLNKRSSFDTLCSSNFFFNENGKQLACSLVGAVDADPCDLNIRAQSLILLSIDIFPCPSLLQAKRTFTPCFRECLFCYREGSSPGPQQAWSLVPTWSTTSHRTGVSSAKQELHTSWLLSSPLILIFIDLKYFPIRIY